MRSKNFIYKLWYGIFVKPIVEIKTLHENIKAIEHDNPYSVLRSWSLDMAQYMVALGLITTVFWRTLWWYDIFVIGFGLALARWFILDFLGDILKKIKGR